MPKGKKLRRLAQVKNTGRHKIIYYLSSGLLFFYLIFSILELATLFHDIKRVMQIPILIFVFIASVVLPYLIIKYISAKKKSTLANIIFVSRAIALFWIVLVLILFWGLASHICFDFSCWYLLLPILWFAPLFVLSLCALTILTRDKP